MEHMVLRREATALKAALGLTLVGTVGYCLSRTTTLTLAVAHMVGTKNARNGAFAARLAGWTFS